MAKAPYFYDCILIDGYRYKTVAKQWKPASIRPSSARVNLLGDLEATYGSFTILRWEGMVVAEVVAPAKKAGKSIRGVTLNSCGLRFEKPLTLSSSTTTARSTTRPPSCRMPARTASRTSGTATKIRFI